MDCYVLDTGERVVSLQAAVRSIADVDHGKLGDQMGVKALKAFEFHIPGTQSTGLGISAERFLEICNAYVGAQSAGALSTERQQEIAVRCSIVLGACAERGLIPLIDEATGYQYQRAEEALQLKLKVFIADDLREWEKTFPDELWEQFGRLTKWKGPLHSRPKWWGKLVMELIYEALDKDVAEHLRNEKPPPRTGQSYGQWMKRDFGLRALIPHIFEVIGIAKTCGDIRELRDRVAEHYGQQEYQFTLYLKPPR